jgi:hypothetical protein
VSLTAKWLWLIAAELAALMALAAAGLLGG